MPSSSYKYAPPLASAVTAASGSSTAIGLPPKSQYQVVNLLVTFTLGAFVCGQQWWRQGGWRWAAATGLCLGLMLATKASALLLSHLFRHPRAGGLLVLASYRDVEIAPGHPITEALSDLRRPENGDRLRLEGLDLPAVTALVDQSIMVNEAAPEGEEYVLLAHKDSGIHSVADLEGRKLSVYDHPKMNLARVWLDMLLANAKLGPVNSLFSNPVGW